MLLEKIKNLRLQSKVIILITFDILLIFISSYISEIIYLTYLAKVAKSLLLYSTISIIFFSIYSLIFKFYSQLNRYFGIYHLQKILILVLLLAASLYLFKYIYDLRYLNLNFIILQNLILFLFISLSRYTLQVLYFHRSQPKKKINSIIFGAGSDGINFYRNLKNNKNYNFIGFVDEDNNKIGRFADDLKIYSPNKILYEIKNIQIQKCFLCIPSASSFKIKEISKNLLKNNIDVIQTKNFESTIKLPNEINNENRINLKNSEDKDFKGKNALVTGAAGSIGQEICFQLNFLDTKSIYCLDNNEYSLANLKKKAETLNIKNFKYILLDVTNEKLLDDFFRANKIDFVFHAAAHKHVDIVEDNITYSCQNNLFAILNILKKVIKFKVKNFIFISTDKAVRPKNVMGLTKRVGELLTYYYSQLEKGNNYCSVRFGNVIGSSGSLLEILKRQISYGGPITLTDKKASRYFMTISDAVSLVLRSSNLKKNGMIYILNMGEPVNIYELIKSFLKENDLTEKSNKNKNGDIEIKTIGLRKGEKLHEELFYSENYKEYDKMIFAEEINQNFKTFDLNNFEKELKSYIEQNSEIKIKKFLNDVLNHK